MKNAVIVAYGRSAIGKAFKGSLKDISPVDLGAQVLKGVLAKTPNLNAEDIDDVIVGCAMPEGLQGQNFARNVVLEAGLPERVPAQTVNRFCSSGLQTMSMAKNSIESGEADVVVAGGVEVMSTMPMLGTHPLFDSQLIQTELDAYASMGITAENVAAKYDISRLEQDTFAVESHNKSVKASQSGFFDDEIIPVKHDFYVAEKDGSTGKYQTLDFKVDECMRPGSKVEKLAEMKSPFKHKGSVTAANASQMSDGAGFVIMMSEEKAKELSIKPIAKLLTFQVEGLSPALMGLGPTVAIPKALKKANLNIDDLDVIELNEAFASQAIASIKELSMDSNKVNINGGAISMGHPLGATGAVLTSKLLNILEKQDQKYGLVSMCIGGGMGAAGIFERL